MFFCDEISSEIVLWEKIWVPRVPEGDKAQVLVLLSGRIPCRHLSSRYHFLTGISRYFSCISPSPAWIFGHKIAWSGLMVPYLNTFIIFIQSRHSVLVGFLLFSTGSYVDLSHRKNHWSFRFYLPQYVFLWKLQSCDNFRLPRLWATNVYLPVSQSHCR